MSDARPYPDELLAAVNAEETKGRHGKLRIFFGASAGVGKTYAMLDAARSVRASGGDIVIGYAEPHGRAETEQLLEGMEQLPTVAVRYRGVSRREFDLDAGLKRAPAILVVDELAHSNLTEGDPQPRHAKRWQDIEELLEQGVEVWTTVNVQHIESLNDLVAQITGVRQRETIPDRIFDEADEVELIDLPPDDLIARLKSGKVYVSEQAAAAIERFFRKSNLIALRELALRRLADRVDAAARASALADRSFLARTRRDRLLAAIGPDSQAEQVVRAGKRIADGLDAQWTVVYVETPDLLRLSAAERNRRIDLLRLAESLGAETVTLDGPSAAQVLAEYARTRNATRVIVGAPKPRRLRAWWRRSTTTELVRRARGFDVITIGVAGEARSIPERRAGAACPELAAPINWDRYAWALGTSVFATAIAFAMQPYFELSNIVMAYVLASTIVAVRFGRGPAVAAAIVNVIAFDFCFAPPRFVFTVTDIQYVVMLCVMLIVAVTIANLMASIRQQIRVAAARERRTASLYAMSRELAAMRTVSNMARAAVRHVAEVFNCKAVVLLPDANGRLHCPGEPPIEGSFKNANLSIAQWVADHGRRAGLGSDTLPAAPALYVPLSNQRQRLGVLAVLPENRRRILLPEQSHLLETFAAQLGVALERAQLADSAAAARVAAQTEQLRNTLVASISHDLRTPLSVIAGASSALAGRGVDLTEESRTALARSIETKAQEMAELVSNVLDLMRLQSGQIAPRPERAALDDLVSTALDRTRERLRAHRVEVAIPRDLPHVQVDAMLTVQIFVNMLDNVAKYTPPGTRVHIHARAKNGFVRVFVEDEGPGLPADGRDRLFDKFQRGRDEGAVAGAGLGLAVCRAVVRAHGGEIRAGERPGGGARFQFTLPVILSTEAADASSRKSDLAVGSGE